MVLFCIQNSRPLRVNRDFIEEIPDDQIEDHYLPHHQVFKKSTTTPLRIMFNAASKPAGRKSLNYCLTEPTLTAKLHDILLSFRKGELTCIADISKTFHRVKVDEQDRDFLNS